MLCKLDMNYMPIFRCKWCTGAYITKEEILAHYTFMHPFKSPPFYLCDHCDFSCTSNNVMFDHCKQNHAESEVTKTFKCPKCDFSTHRANTMKVHMERHYVKLVCSYCGKILKSEITLREHIKLWHEEFSTEQNHVCQQCDFKTHHEVLLKRHIYHRHERKQKCEHCGKLFTCLSQMYCHIDCVHRDLDIPKEHVCDFCAKPFIYAYSLDQHRKVKHTNKLKMYTKAG